MQAREKPYAPSCDENKAPILDVIRPLFETARHLLEIGSGTGQHAVCFAAAMPHLTWQTSEVAENLPGIHAWLDEANLPNLIAPIALDVTRNWPNGPFDAVFSANTSHIMPIEAVEAMFQGVGRILTPGGPFALYGPFNRNGTFTSDSNRRFDGWLKTQNPRMGVRDLADLQTMARNAGLSLVAEHPMPANNLTLIWQRDPV